MIARLLCALLGHRKPVRMAHAGFGGYYEDLECPRCRCSVDTALGFPCSGCGRAAFFVTKQPRAGELLDPGRTVFFAAHVEAGASARVECQWCGSPEQIPLNVAEVRTFWTDNGEAVRPVQNETR